MSWLRPSLVRRLTLGFIVGHIVALLLFLIALLPLSRDDDEDQIGPDLVISMLTADLIDRGGRLGIASDGELAEFSASKPRVWFVARQGDRMLRGGPVPQQALRLVATLTPIVKTAEFGNIGGGGRAGDASIATADTAVGRVVVAAGGVGPDDVSLGAWIRFLHRELYAYVPIGSAVLTLLGGLIAIPLVVGSVRPTVRAATSIDPSDLDKRLPERKVVKELLPLVRAFNHALDRLAAGFERRRRFIADVAHELRTPLAILNMNMDSLPDDPTKRDLQRIVYRLGEMVGQMLDAERLALAGRRREEVDLVELARSAVAETAPLAVANGYELGLSARCERVVVRCDPHSVARALTNLIGNAIAHGGGSGAIEVVVGAKGTIEVRDQGPGIAVEARERVFEPFHRERWDRDGCGLGLHLVREIMHAHGGEVRIVGASNGARFRLEFPPPRQSLAAQGAK